MKNPLMSVTWEIECESDEIKEYAETALGHRLRTAATSTGVSGGVRFCPVSTWASLLFERMYVTLDEQGMPMREERHDGGFRYEVVSLSAQYQRLQYLGVQ